MTGLWLEKLASGLTSDTQWLKEYTAIKEFQATGNPRSIRDVMEDYKGIRMRMVDESGLPGVIGYKEAHGKGLEIFQDMLKNNINLDRVKPPNGNKVSTYIMGAFPNLLKNEFYEQQNIVSRQSRDLEQNSATVDTAMKHFEMEHFRKPTADELYDYIQADDFAYGKGLDKGKIKRILSYKRDIFSGSEEVSSNDDGDDSPFMTFGDMMESSDKDSATTAFERQNRDRVIKKVISNFPYNEKKFIQEYFGIGSYDGASTGNLARASLNNNLTPFEAKEVMKTLKDKLSAEGVDLK